MTYVLPLLIIAASDSFFSLIPYTGNSQDLGIPLIVIGLAYYIFVKRSDIRPLNNFFTWYVIFYLLLVVTQVSVAAFKYSQPIMDGLLAGRDQLYYLAFPIFLLTLSDPSKARTFMKAISMLAVVLVLLAVVHYGLGVTVFQRFAEEGQGVSERAGMIRVKIPGMNVLIIGLLWLFWSYLQENRFFSVNLAMFFVTFGGLIFRQSRGRIITVTAVLLLMLISRKRYGLLAAATTLAVFVVAANVFFGDVDNPFVYAFESAYSEIVAGGEGGGTWLARVQQFEASWNDFVSGFATGTGGSVLRHNTLAEQKELLDIGLSTDLGYWVFIKYFGYWGILYLGAILIGFFWYVLRCYKFNVADDIVKFVTFYFISILISLVNINYLTRPEGIVMVCLAWALIVKAEQTAMTQRGAKQASV